MQFLAENKLVLYMNQDKSGYGHSEGLLVEVDNKMVLSRIEDFSGEECTGISLGWQQQKGFDKIKELKKIPSLTGGIVVSSQSYPAIKIEGSEVGPLQQNGDF